MSALESLSNKELRQKCMEFGMPNIPVTDSSRKVLIRRLDAAMSGKPLTKTPSKTNRRETMHVSKPSEMASSPKITAINNNNVKPALAANRPSRRTIAATTERHVTATTTVSEPEYSDVSPDRGEVPMMLPPKTKTPERPSRRNITNINERHVTTTTTVSEPEYSDVSPDRGEIPMMLPPKKRTPERPKLYPTLPTKENSPKPQMLSKTGVVTTSYMQESNINKTYAAPDDIDSTEEDIQEPVKKTLSNPKPPSYTNYVPLSEAKVSTSVPLSSTLSSSTRYSSLGSSYNYNKPPTLTTSNLRQTYTGPSVSSYSQSRRTHQYVADDLDAEDFEDDEEDDEDDVVLIEDSPGDKDMETPFLSQFARNLETLKATPLRHSMGPTKITPPKSSSSSSLRNREAAYTRRTIGATGNIAPRRTLMNPEQDNSPFREFMMAMEEKYHLKQTFIIISVFILAIFIYVFFIQSV